MIALDAARIDALARELALSPRELLVAALRLACADAAGANTDERQRHAIAAVRAAPDESEAVAALLLTPIASFAKDDIDRALATLWPPPMRVRD